MKPIYIYKNNETNELFLDHLEFRIFPDNEAQYVGKLNKREADAIGEILLAEKEATTPVHSEEASRKAVQAERNTQARLTEVEQEIKQVKKVVKKINTNVDVLHETLNCLLTSATDGLSTQEHQPDNKEEFQPGETVIAYLMRRLQGKENN